MHHVDACAAAKLVVCSACCQLAGCQDDAILRGGTGVYAREFQLEITRAMHAG